MMNNEHTPNIVVLGHRGGAGKTAVAAGLIAELARLGKAPLAFDFAIAGGVSSLNYSFVRGPEPPMREGAPGPHIIHRHQGLDAWFAVPRGESAETWSAAAATTEWAISQGRASVIHDFPVSSIEEVAPALRAATVALLVIPAEGLAFRSLPELLERLQAERARPGRSFAVKALLVESPLPTLERSAMEAFLAEHLGPILLDTRIPQDAHLRKAMSSGHLPDVMPADSPAARAFARLAREMLQLSAAPATARS